MKKSKRNERRKDRTWMGNEERMWANAWAFVFLSFCLRMCVFLCAWAQPPQSERWGATVGASVREGWPLHHLRHHYQVGRSWRRPLYTCGPPLGPPLNHPVNSPLSPLMVPPLGPPSLCSFAGSLTFISVDISPCFLEHEAKWDANPFGAVVCWIPSCGCDSFNLLHLFLLLGLLTITPDLQAKKIYIYIQERKWKDPSRVQIPLSWFLNTVTLKNWYAHVFSHQHGWTCHRLPNQTELQEPDGWRSGGESR